MIKCIIVDDEPKAREVIVRYIDKVESLSFVKDFKDPVKAIAFLNNNNIDLVFLDINMPGLNGLELIQSLKNKPKIIFTTAYSDYALQGFENDAIDYLLKPIRFERFLKAIGKIPKDLNERNAPQRESVIIKSGNRTYKILLDEILFFEKDGNYIEIVLQNEKKVLLRENMSNLFNIFPHSKFIRVHKSFVVSKDKINAVEVNKVILKTGIKIPMGASFRDAVMLYFTS